LSHFLLAKTAQVVIVARVNPENAARTEAIALIYIRLAAHGFRRET
jgi:hypothetical protein